MSSAPQARPPITVLSGSTRFRREFRAVEHGLTLAGHIVLSCGVFSHAEGTTPTQEEKTLLDALHLAKIDLADTVCVINPCGYIGNSTRAEISYARAHGKKVVYLVPPAQDQGSRSDIA